MTVKLKSLVLMAVSLLLIVAAGCSQQPTRQTDQMVLGASVNLDTNRDGAIDVEIGGTGGKSPSQARSSLGLGNVDNTSDAEKPLSNPAKSYVDSAVIAGGGYNDSLAKAAAGSMVTGSTQTGISVTYNPTTAKINFVSDFSGLQPLNPGLTTLSSPNTWRTFYSNGSGTITQLALGAAGTVFRSNGPTLPPTWEVAAGTGDMIGPATSTSNYIPLFSGSTGKQLQQSQWYIDSTGIHAPFTDGSMVAKGPNNTVAPVYANWGDGQYVLNHKWYMIENGADVGEVLSKNDLNTQAKFESLLGWSLPASSGGGTISITEQAADPAASTMSTGQLIVSKASGDLFYKSSTGLYVVPGSYTVNPASGSCTVGNILSETFNATGFDNTWTQGYVTAGAASNPDLTAPALTGFSGQSYQASVPATAYSEAWHYWADGTAKTAAYLRFYLNVSSSSLVAGSSFRLISYGSNNTYPSGLIVGVRQDASAGLMLTVQPGAGGDEVTSALVVGTPVLIEISATNNGATDTSVIKINGSQISSQSGPLFDADFTRVDLGVHPDSSSAAVFSAQIDNLDISNTGWLGGCN